MANHIVLTSYDLTLIHNTERACLIQPSDQASRRRRVFPEVQTSNDPYETQEYLLPRFFKTHSKMRGVNISDDMQIALYRAGSTFLAVVVFCKPGDPAPWVRIRRTTVWDKTVEGNDWAMSAEYEMSLADFDELDEFVLPEWLEGLFSMVRRETIQAHVHVEQRILQAGVKDAWRDGWKSVEVSEDKRTPVKDAADPICAATDEPRKPRTLPWTYSPAHVAAAQVLTEESGEASGRIAIDLTIPVIDLPRRRRTFPWLRVKDEKTPVGAVVDSTMSPSEAIKSRRRTLPWLTKEDEAKSAQVVVDLTSLPKKRRRFPWMTKEDKFTAAPLQRKRRTLPWTTTEDESTSAQSSPWESSKKRKF
ncbi:unnamed protein product [Zymoseptoria tritici ST99CH_1A5]|uniref:Uncharacterized protein n=3 Tax=Zymoseptoria tritici TaxID=1047171 RepID=A0A1X7RCM5_ZYMT9|nr:unnamed protein product [Zymoseptoria tritici ST99CH_3D7]SMR41348.1 unnamed protein product [Zymoseptoria tritici ST99CH_1E4]SMR43549.1 unnamed protein product [Zymoseptoria tritici ST99CH_3D1]SMY18694.1 unnamed protein product [Zymoseptoria tritici ST99CH_1A5]